MKNPPLMSVSLFWQHHALLEMDQVHLMTSDAFDSVKSWKKEEKDFISKTKNNSTTIQVWKSFGNHCM